MFSDSVLIALITGVLGPVLAVVVVWWRDRIRARTGAVKDLREAQKLAMDGEATLAGATLAWATQLRSEISDLKSEVGALRGTLRDVQEENLKLRRHNALLSAQVVDLGGKPLPMPDW